MLVLLFPLLVTCVSRLECVERKISRRLSSAPAGQHQPYAARPAVFEIGDNSSEFGNGEITYGPRAIRLGLHTPLQSVS